MKAACEGRIPDLYVMFMMCIRYVCDAMHSKHVDTDLNAQPQQLNGHAQQSAASPRVLHIKG